MLSFSKVKHQHQYHRHCYQRQHCLHFSQHDADFWHLSGMKQDKAGFPMEAFPWTGEDETKEDERRQ